MNRSWKNLKEPNQNRIERWPLLINKLNKVWEKAENKQKDTENVIGFRWNILVVWYMFCCGAVWLHVYVVVVVVIVVIQSILVFPNFFTRTNCDCHRIDLELTQTEDFREWISSQWTKHWIKVPFIQMNGEFCALNVCDCVLHLRQQNIITHRYLVAPIQCDIPFRFIASIGVDQLSF